MSQSHTSLGRGERREAARWPLGQLPPKTRLFHCGTRSKPEARPAGSWEDRTGPPPTGHLSHKSTPPPREQKLMATMKRKRGRGRKKGWRESPRKSSINWKSVPRSCIGNYTARKLINVTRNQAQEALEKCTQGLGLRVVVVCWWFVKKGGQKYAFFCKTGDCHHGKHIPCHLTDGHLNCYGPQADLQPCTPGTSRVWAC